MPLQVFHPLLQWTMPRPFIYSRLSPVLDGKILFCEVALLHPKQFIVVLLTRHPDTTRDDLLLLGVFYTICLLAPFESSLFSDFGRIHCRYVLHINPLTCSSSHSTGMIWMLSTNGHGCRCNITSSFCGQSVIPRTCFSR